jgi:hypothetical protein
VPYAYCYRSNDENAARDAQTTAAGTEWTKMNAPRPTWRRGRSRCDPTATTAAGPVTENGWMVPPEFQERGLAKQAVRMLLELARDNGRAGSCTRSRQQPKPPRTASAAPTASGSPVQDVIFAGRILRSNHQVIDPAADPA